MNIPKTDEIFNTFEVVIHIDYDYINEYIRTSQDIYQNQEFMLD